MLFSLSIEFSVGKLLWIMCRAGLSLQPRSIVNLFVIPTSNILSCITGAISVFVLVPICYTWIKWHFALRTREANVKSSRLSKVTLGKLCCYHRNYFVGYAGWFMLLLYLSNRPDTVDHTGQKKRSWKCIRRICFDTLNLLWYSGMKGFIFVKIYTWRHT